MGFCKNCGHQIGENRFCENCGAELEPIHENSNAMNENQLSPKRTSRKKRMLVGGSLLAIAVAAGFFFVMDPFQQHSDEIVKEVRGSEPEVNDELPEEEISDEEKSFKEEVVSEVEEERNSSQIDTAGFAIQTSDLLKIIEEGSIMGAMHMGMTEEALIEEVGEPLNKRKVDGDVQLEYKDSFFTLSSNNGLIYAATLKPVHTISISFDDIEKHFGEGNDSVFKERKKEADGLYSLSYGSGDSSHSFYSPTAEGNSIVKFKYAYVPISFADISDVTDMKPINPGKVEPIILDIRKQFNEINDSATSRNTKEIITAEGNRKELSINESGFTKKAVEHTSEGTVDYYFDDKERLLFVFFFNGNVENRFYFWNDQLVRWINENGEIVDYEEGQQNQEYPIWQKRWLDTAYELDSIKKE